MSKVFFTSDQHGFHGNIIKFAGRTGFMTEDEQRIWRSGHNQDLLAFSEQTVDLMNRTLLDSINSAVGYDDELYILGDFVWGHGSTYRKNAVWFRDGINCRKVHFAVGNHDEEKVIEKLGLFQSMFHLLDLSIEGQPITLCHYPMRSWNKSYHGAWQLYGHVHGRTWEADMKGSLMTLDVGVDTPHGMTPWSFEEIKEHMGRIYPRFRAHRSKAI